MALDALETTVSVEHARRAVAVEAEQEGPTAEDRNPSDVIIRGPPDWCDHPSDVITWPMDPTHTMRLLEKRCGTMLPRRTLRM